ncbi:MAG: PD-(D/E)XK nuclease family protein [Myxococcales bacterium]|nr:PD-(D/E)XK nuclease family protein [Myxococcales bacterium]
MWDRLDAWLSERIRPPQRLGDRVLVLCRTRATLSLVRRWAAARGGLHGVDVATPSSLASLLTRPTTLLPPDEGVLDPTGPALPPETLAAQRIGPRPGLTAVARRWTQWTRLARAADHDGDGPDWLEELVGTPWAEDDEERALLELLDRTAELGLGVAEVAWDRAVAIGFDVPPVIVEPWEHTLLRTLHLGAQVAPPTAPPTDPIRAVQAPDVAAEARLAVSHAARDPEGTVILVASEATARRVRDAAARSGLPCAWRDRLALRTHELASAVMRCVPWFGPTDPWIQVSDLAAVLGQTAFGRDLHPAAEAWLERRLKERGLEGSQARLSRRRVARVLQDARLLEAPLRLWLQRMEELGEPVSAARADRARAARATSLEVRLRLLAAAVEGQPIDEALRDEGELLDYDADDFEAIVAELLGEVPGDAPAHTPTLGAVRSFLVSFRVQVHGDPVARAVLGALGRRASWPADPAHAAHALSGTIDPGLSPDGVQIVSYADWDGRPARQLLLLDVHDKGLARRPSPDPLLSDPELRALGARTPSSTVEHAIQQAGRAAAAADRALAIVSRRDADGREVVPPVRLALDLSAEDVPSYGIGLPDVAESKALRGLVRGEGAPRRPEHPDPDLSRIATQATAEWYREGRGPTPTASSRRRVATLEQLLHQEEGQAPAWLGPYLGIAGVPEAALPERPHSATGLLTAVSHCMYQAFARHVLELNPLEEIEEDLDPKEVGQAVHDALQRATGSARWRVPESDRDSARDRFVKALEEQTAAAFEAATRDLGALSHARQSSAHGRLERWNKHWPAFAASRITGPPSQRDLRYAEVEHVRNHPAFLAAIQAIRAHSPAAEAVGDWLLCRWLLEVGSMPADRFTALAPSVQRDTGSRTPLPEAMEPDLADIVRDPTVEVLRRVLRNLRWRASSATLPVTAIAAEVPFGFDEVEAVPVIGPNGEAIGTLAIGEVQLDLGQGPVTLRGRIDRLMVVGTKHGPLVEITDYKTGRPPPGWRFRRALHTVEDPQLLVYALVLDHLRQIGRLPDPLQGAKVASVAWDHVRNTFKEPERRWQLEVPDTTMLVDTDVLDLARSTLGALLDRARRGSWPLRPRSDTCPALSAYGNDRCPFVGACRLRGLAQGDAT